METILARPGRAAPGKAPPAPGSLLIRTARPVGAPLSELAAPFEGRALAHLFLFVSPAADFEAVLAEAETLFDCPVSACTTAGEIGPEGYAEESIIAIGLPARHFAAETFLTRPLDRLAGSDLPDRIVRARIDLTADRPDFPTGFAFLMIDGLSRSEDAYLTTIAPSLGHLPLFGGSAGDGRAFGRTRVGLGGRAYDDAAVLTIVATDCRVRVFSLDHMTPTDARMVVTSADPETRTVKEINGAPAAREYARLVGVDPEQLDTFTFAARPVAVRLGDEHHVRAIQRVTPEGELVFFSAIDEGMVLSISEASDMAAHLDAELGALSPPDQPADIIACDCILRRIEAEQLQKGRAVSDILKRHNVVGFSTYGEQIGPIHVNHTMTGVALYPPSGETELP